MSRRHHRCNSCCYNNCCNDYCNNNCCFNRRYNRGFCSYNRGFNNNCGCSNPLLWLLFLSGGWFF